MSPRMSVPLPTPEGPVMTNTRAKARTLVVVEDAASHRAQRPRSRWPAALVMQQRDELAALALGEPADGLAGRDAAVSEDLVDLDAPVLGDGEQHVEDLGGLDVLGRLEQQRVDRAPAGLEVALELCALDTDLVGAGERI